MFFIYNSFLRYGEGNDDVSNRGWPRRRDYDRRNQRLREREQDQRYITSAIVRWLADDEEYEPYEEVPFSYFYTLCLYRKRNFSKLGHAQCPVENQIVFHISQIVKVNNVC